MTKTEILGDLDYIKTMAEEGHNAPLLGGPIGLMWGILSSITLLVHWAVLIGHISLPVQNIGVIWMVFGITGGVLSMFMGRKISSKSGASSVGNRVESAVWISSTILIFVYVFSIVLSYVAAKNTALLFDTIPAFAFGCQFLCYSVIAKMSDQKWLWLISLLSLAFVPICMFLLGNPELYIAASLGVILTVIAPALLSIRNQPRELV